MHGDGARGEPDAREQGGAGVLALGQVRRMEGGAAVHAVEEQGPVRQYQRSVAVELVACDAIVLREGARGPGAGIVAAQAHVGADPEPSLRIGEDAVDHVVR